MSVQHILLGLVAGDGSKTGLLGSGLTLERARSALQSGGGKKHLQDMSAQELPFSLDAKKVFEAALTVGYDCQPVHL